MPWIPRPLGPNLCYHVRVQCNNRAFRFETNDDFRRYVDILTDIKRKLGFLLHHFTIMRTHVHLMLTTPGPVLLDRIMQVLNHHYAVDYHRRHNRTGHFWMHGYRCAIIDSDTYALTCLRYLDRNALRAGLVKDPSEWPWCSHTLYAYGHSPYTLNEHESYVGIAEGSAQRQAWYREFVTTLLPTDEAREKEMIGYALRRYGPTRRRPKRRN